MKILQTEDLKKLKKEIPYQWRVQSFSKQKASCSCVAYIDSRDVQNLLDEVVGAENWQDKYEMINDQMFCSIGIKCGNEWIWKSDTGKEGTIEKEKSLVSNSFKRAAVKWGIGRFTYDLGIEYLATNEPKKDNNYPYPVDNNGTRIWDLSKFINDKHAGNTPAKAPEPKSEIQQAIDEMAACKTKEQAAICWTKWAMYKNDARFLQAKEDKKTELTVKPAAPAANTNIPNVNEL